MEDVKSKLIKASVDYVENRIGRFNETMRELEEALKPESRSCMGDKYETSRAMLHLEFEKVSGQVEQFNTLRKTASLIDKQPVLSKVGFGSVVKTSTANYFIAIPAGEIKVGDKSYYVVGINSPVARELLGKEAGDTFNINGKTTTIKEIF